MVRDVLVKIGENQKQLKHAVTLVGIRIARAFFEILHDCQCVREKPLNYFCVRGNAAAATVKRLIGALECLVQKMIEAELLACKGQGNRL